MSKFCTNDNRISTRSLIDKLLSIRKYLPEYYNILTWTNSSVLSTTARLMAIGNYYNCSQSICSFCFIPWFITATRHYLATF